MLHSPSNPPRDAYGILSSDTDTDPLETLAEQIRRLGYGILDAGFSAEEITNIRAGFDATYASYSARHGHERLKAADEHNTIRMPMAENPDPFRRLALNPRLLNLLGRLIHGQFILNQQNGIINPAQQEYNQGKWHRDLPYQHFLSSTPLAVNALYCVDDFTPENGSTWVLPASHKAANFPSGNYRDAHALQVSAKAGSYIVLDCMIFHSGGFNRSGAVRRAVNHVYTIPYFKQQIRMAGNIEPTGLTTEEQRIFGLTSAEPESVEMYLQGRAN